MIVECLLYAARMDLFQLVRHKLLFKVIIFCFYVLDTGKFKTFCIFNCLAFTDVAGCPAPAMLLMQKLLAMPPKSLWQIAHTFISHFRSILDDAVPRQVQGMFFYNLKIIEEL